MTKSLFGISSLIMSGAFLVWSIGETFAYPQGANISLGSNPNVSFFSSACNGGEVVTTVPAGQVLIITDIISGVSDADDNIQLSTGSGILGSFKVDYHVTGYSSGATHRTMNNAHYKLTSGVVVPASETLSVTCSSNLVTLTGYYAQM